MRVSLTTATVEGPAGATVSITRSKERTLLSMLALTPSRPVSVDRLIDGLWGDEPPRTAAKTLQTYVKNLRGRLAEAGISRDTLRTEPPGYMLAIDDNAVDVLQFERIIADAGAAASSGNVDLAHERYSSALRLFDDASVIAFEGPGTSSADVRLAEIRRRAVDDHTDIRLERGDHHKLVEELSERLDREPQNERAWGQLMVALYRSDRQRDALQAFARARDRLGKEFGLEPGPALLELERQIISHDLPAAHPTDSRSAAGADVVLTISAPGVSREEIEVETERAIESAAEVARVDGSESVQMIFPSIDDAVLAALRISCRLPSCSVIGHPFGTEVGPAQAMRSGVVFVPELGNHRTFRRWSMTAIGWQPASVEPVRSRVPVVLSHRRDRNTPMVERRIPSRLGPALAEAANGGVETVLLSGPGGIGKTVAALELSEAAHELGFTVLYGQADPSATNDRAAVVQAAYQAVGALRHEELVAHVLRFGPALANLLPEISTRAGETDLAPASSPPGQIDAALCDLLQRVSRNCPTLLIIDDAPLLDDGAVRLLIRLLNDQRTRSLCVLFTERIGDPDTPATASEILDICRQGTTMTLEPFSIDETARFLEAAAGTPRSARTVPAARFVHRSTGGLPLFVREMAHDITASGTWIGPDGRWRLDVESTTPALPRTVRELMEQRLMPLDESARQLIRAAAVLESFSPELLSETVNTSLSSILFVLDELLERRILDLSPGLADHYQFAHPLLRQAALDEVGPGARATLAMAAATWLQNLPAPTPAQLDRGADLLYRARPLAADSVVKAELLHAADAATERGDHGRAIFHLERMLELGQSSGAHPDLGTVLAIAEASVRAQSEIGVRQQRARAAFREAQRVAAPEAIARAALAFAGPFNPYGALVAIDDEAAFMAETALSSPDLDPTLEARLWGMLAASKSDMNAGATEIDVALGRARASEDIYTLGEMLSLENAIKSDPRLDRMAIDREIVKIGRRTGALQLELQGESWLASRSLEYRDFSQMERAASRRVELAERLDDAVYAWNAMVHRTMRQSIAGQFDEAEHTLWRTLEAGRVMLGEHANRFFGLQLVTLAHLRGRVDSVLDMAEGFAASVDHVSADITLAHLLARNGDTERAAGIVSERLSEGLPELGYSYELLPGLAQLADIAQRSDNPRLAAQVASRIEPFLGRMCVHAEAVLYGATEHVLAKCRLTQGDADIVELLSASEVAYRQLGADAWLLFLEDDRCRWLDACGDTTAAEVARPRLVEAAAAMGLAL